MFVLKNVIPEPLTSTVPLSSNIWATECFFEKGKNYLVTAPSGKGKSTFMHLLYGLRHDYEGTILYQQKDIKTFSSDDWAAIRQRQLSLVYQNLNLFPNLSALDNLLLASEMVDNYTSTEALKEMAAALAVDQLLSQKIATLSYGQRQRIAIIRALSQPFDFLLLDEPFSHLDDENIQKASTLIANICKKQQAGIILVSLGASYLFDYQKELIL